VAEPGAIPVENRSLIITKFAHLSAFLIPSEATKVYTESFLRQLSVEMMSSECSVSTESRITLWTNVAESFFILVSIVTDKVSSQVELVKQYPRTTQTNLWQSTRLSEACSCNSDLCTLAIQYLLARVHSSRFTWDMVSVWESFMSDLIDQFAANIGKSHESLDNISILPLWSKRWLEILIVGRQGSGHSSQSEFWTSLLETFPLRESTKGQDTVVTITTLESLLILGWRREYVLPLLLHLNSMQALESRLKLARSVLSLACVVVGGFTVDVSSTPVRSFPDTLVAGCIAVLSVPTRTTADLLSSWSMSVVSQAKQCISEGSFTSQKSTSTITTWEILLHQVADSFQKHHANCTIALQWISVQSRLSAWLVLGFLDAHSTGLLRDSSEAALSSLLLVLEAMMSPESPCRKLPNFVDVIDARLQGLIKQVQDAIALIYVAELNSFDDDM
jgi:hypothetical protein